MKRSSCASGSGYVPSDSTGFCVAMTKNGRGSVCVTPSTLTVPSFIASSIADWVFGLARLISSAMTTLAKRGPGRKTKSPFERSKTPTPVRSLGSRSEVNWMRVVVPPTRRASARARVVLPTPGTSSRRRWPPARSVCTTSSAVGRLRLRCSCRLRASWADSRSPVGPSAGCAASEGRFSLSACRWSFGRSSASDGVRDGCASLMISLRSAGPQGTGTASRAA